MNAVDYLLSRLRAQRRAAERFGWAVTDTYAWRFPAWRHSRWPYDRERER